MMEFHSAYKRTYTRTHRISERSHLYSEYSIVLWYAGGVMYSSVGIGDRSSNFSRGRYANFRVNRLGKDMNRFLPPLLDTLI